MRQLLFYSLLAAASITALPAQDITSDALARALPFLTSAQRDELKTDFLTALATHPDLALEWKDLLAQLGQPMSSPTDTAALRAKAVALEEKLRTAMTASDQSVGPIIDEIDHNMPNLHPELVGK